MEIFMKFKYVLLVVLLVILSLNNFVYAKKQKLVVGSNFAFAPLNFYNEKREKVGYDIDVINAIAKVINYDVQFESIPWDGLLPALISKKIDIVVSSMSITAERQKKVNFSDPYYTSSTLIVVNKNNKDIKDFSDLENKTIGVNIGTTQAKYVEENLKNPKIVYSNNPEELTLHLVSGKVDAILQDKPILEWFIKNDKTKSAKIVGTPIMDNDNYGIAIRKGDKELLNKINSALKTIKENGVLDSIYKKWFK
jgi:polar amino acid transport system substrate-binding protein